MCCEDDSTAAVIEKPKSPLDWRGVLLSFEAGEGRPILVSSTTDLMSYRRAQQILDPQEY